MTYEDNYDFNIKIIEILIEIVDYLSCNPSTFSPMKIGGYNCRIGL